ncbi:MAG: hypothetical protein ACRD9S_01525 [Pyrinomonadaceae bacterium]
MKKVKPSALIALLIICASSSVVFAQAGTSSLVVLKCSWEKQRIRPRPSLASLASQDELVQQSQREQQLAAAKNAGDKGKVTKLETQISNHQQAKVKASQTELPRDGYQYKVTLLNDGVKTIKSIDWDYLFLDPITQQVLARHEFTSDESIKPGKSKEVSVLYLIPPVKTVSARTLDKKDSLLFAEQVVVVRITYSDGSVWQHP